MWCFTPSRGGPHRRRPPDRRGRHVRLALAGFALLALSLPGCGSSRGFRNPFARDPCASGGGSLCGGGSSCGGLTNGLFRNGFLGRRNGPPMGMMGAPIGDACCDSGIVGGTVIEGIPAPIGATPSTIAVPSQPGVVVPGGVVPQADDVPALEAIPSKASPTSGSLPASQGKTGGVESKPNYQAARPDTTSRLSRREGVARADLTAQGANRAARYGDLPDYRHPIDDLPPLSVSVDRDRPELGSSSMAPPADEVPPPRSAPPLPTEMPAPTATGRTEPSASLGEPGAQTGPDNPESVAFGVRRFRILEPQLAGGSFPTAEGLAWLSEKGYRTLLDLREPSDVRAADLAEANRLGLRYIFLPITAGGLDGAVVERFESELADAKSRPLYFCDGDGTRSGALWYVHRVARDKVAPETAAKEAEALGLSDPKFLLAASAYLESLRPARDPATAPSSLQDIPIDRDKAPAPTREAAPGASDVPPPPPGTLDFLDLSSAPTLPVRDDPTWKLYAAPLAAALCVPLAYLTSTTVASLGQKVRASLPAPRRSPRSLPAASDARS